MKPGILLFGISLAANVALAGFLICTHADESKKHGSPPAQSLHSSQNDTSRQNSHPLWRTIQADDYEQFYKNLLAAGIPSDLSEQIVTAKISNDYYAKVKALGVQPSRPYWHLLEYETPEQAELTKLAEETRKQLELLFGSLMRGLVDEDTRFEQTRERFSHLSEEKISALLMIEQDFEKRRAKWSALPRKTDDEIRQLYEQSAALRAENRAAIEALFTPDELLEYDLRQRGGAAGALRGHSLFLNLTEEEFRALYPVYKEEKEVSSRIYGSTGFVGLEGDALAAEYAAQDAKIAEAEEARKNQIRSILGEDRYADYLQAIDPSQNRLNRIVQRLELPLSAARTIVSVQNDLTQRAAAIDSDASLTNEERTAHYAGLAQEAEARITETLGARGYRAYCDSSKSWIKSLENGKLPQRR